jgi:putative tricarboxylic transport membrane protein
MEVGMRNTKKAAARALGIGIVFTVGITAMSGCTAQEGGGSTDDNGAWKPTRDVVMTVPFAAGGGNDTFAREMADAFEDLRPGLTVVVENREGASGAIGTSEVFQQSGNPHRLLISGSNIVTVPIERKVPYTALDFTAIGQPSAQEAMLVSRAGAYRDLGAVVEQAKREVVTVGVGSNSDLGAIASRLISQKTGARFEFVIFTSGPEMTRAALTGDVDIAINAPENSIEFVKQGTIDALSVFSPERLPGDLGKVPTAKEQGLDVVVEGVRGLWAAPKLSAAETEYWTTLFREWTGTPEFKEYMKSINAVEQIRIGSEFTELVKTFTAAAEQALKGTPR